MQIGYKVNLHGKCKISKWGIKLKIKLKKKAKANLESLRRLLNDRELILNDFKSNLLYTMASSKIATPETKMSILS